MDEPAGGRRTSTLPPRSPPVTTSVAPGRKRWTSEPSPTPGSRSSPLTPTRSAAASSGLGAGGVLSTSEPATRRRSNPCQPSATNLAEMSPHSGPSSPATGPRRTASFVVHLGERRDSGMGSATARQCWRLPPGPSMFSNTGPLASRASATSTPSARSSSSSLASAASASTPINARTRSPSRASASEP
jgi:hypothetical protein